MVTLHYSAITCESVHRVNWSRVSRNHNRLQTLTVNGGIAVGLIFINMVCKKEPPLSVGGASCRGKKNICKCSFIQKESLIVAKTFVSRTVCNCYRPARNKRKKNYKKNQQHRCRQAHPQNPEEKTLHHSLRETNADLNRERRNTKCVI